MTIAGKVAPVPKGDYDISVAYEKLNVVRYNNNVYMAIKPNTGIELTNEEYWMLLMEDVSRAQFDEIINGTTTVGKAKDADTVDGYHASNFFRYHGLATDLFAIKESGFALYNGNTLNTPYKAGLTSATLGLAIVNFGAGENYMSYMAIPSGEKGIYTCGRDGKWDKDATKTDLAKYLPRDGSVPMNGNLKIQSGDFSTMEVRTTDVATKGKGTVEVGVNHVNLRAINDDTHKNYRSLVLNNSARESDIKNALQFSETVNSVNTVYNVLHTGNFPVEEGTFNITLADGTVVFNNVYYVKYGKLVIIQHVGTVDAWVNADGKTIMYGLPLPIKNTFNALMWFTANTSPIPINTQTQHSQFLFNSPTSFYVNSGSALETGMPSILFGMYIASE